MHGCCQCSLQEKEAFHLGSQYDSWGWDVTITADSVWGIELANPSSSTIHPFIPIIPPSKYKGEPSIKRSAALINSLSQPFKYALIGKFSHGRPSMEATRQSFQTFGLKAAFSLGHLDVKHILIRVNHEADFQRLWIKDQSYLGRFPMRVFKWSPDFRPDFESSIVLVWFSLLGLPIHLFHKSTLFSIANLIGRPIMIDQPTAALSRPSVARVCIEIDLKKLLPKRVWVYCGSDFEGFWQALKGSLVIVFIVFVKGILS